MVGLTDPNIPIALARSASGSRARQNGSTCGKEKVDFKHRWGIHFKLDPDYLTEVPSER